jgi:hypothetical protein
MSHYPAEPDPDRRNRGLSTEELDEVAGGGLLAWLYAKAVKKTFYDSLSEANDAMGDALDRANDTT